MIDPKKLFDKDKYWMWTKIAYAVSIVAILTYLLISYASFTPPKPVPPITLTGTNGLSTEAGKISGSVITGFSGERGVLAKSVPVKLTPGYYVVNVTYSAVSNYSMNFRLSYNISEGDVFNIPLFAGSNATVSRELSVLDNQGGMEWVCQINHNDWNYVSVEKVEFIMKQNQVPTRLILPAWLLAFPVILPLLIIILSIYKQRGKRSKKNTSLEAFLGMSLGFALLPSFSEFFLFLSVVVLIIYIITVRGSIYFEWRRRDWALAAFVAIAIIGGFFALDKGTAIGAALIFALFYFFYQFMKSLPADSISYQRVISMSAIGIILWGVFAVVHYLVLKSPLDITFGASSLGWIQAADGDGNLTSIFQYGSMGAYLVVLVSMFFSHYMFFNYKRLSWWEWPVYTAAIVLTVLIALLISGRGALILLGAFWFIMILFSRRWILFAGVIILGAIFFIVPNPKFRDSLQYITNPSQIPNMGGRLEQYNAAWTILNDGNEAYGVGLGNFHYHFQKRYPIQYENSPVQFVHNGYLSILVETGFAGFAVYMFYFIAFLIYAYRRSIRNIKSSILGAALLTGFLLISLFDAIFYNVFLGILVWMLMGLSQNTQYDDFIALEKTGAEK
jgi:O-antigen ligase